MHLERFVSVKSIEQQAILSVHRVRQGFVKARSAQADQIRGLLASLDWSSPKGSNVANEFEREIIAWHRSSELNRKLEKIPGIGPLGCEPRRATCG
jgi:transposase